MLNSRCINNSLSCKMTHTCCHTHAVTQGRCIDNSIFQASVFCGVPCPPYGGGGKRLAAEDREGHSLTRTSHLSIPPLCLSLACVCLCVNFWSELAPSATINDASLPLIFIMHIHRQSQIHTHTLFSQRPTDFTLKLAYQGGQTTAPAHCDSSFSSHLIAESSTSS